jgi:hypothetical protein
MGYALTGVERKTLQAWYAQMDEAEARMCAEMPVSSQQMTLQAEIEAT